MSILIEQDNVDIDRASTWDVITNDLKLISEFLLKQTILPLFSSLAQRFSSFVKKFCLLNFYKCKFPSGAIRMVSAYNCTLKTA